MYKPFSEHRFIEKMIRHIYTFIEQEVLEVNILPFEDKKIYKNYPSWVKYVSTRSKDPREVFLYWDTKIEDMFLAQIMERILNEKGYLDNLDKYFSSSYTNFKKFSDRFYEKGSGFYKQLTNKQLIKLFNEFSKYDKPAIAGYYIVYDLSLLLSRYVEQELKKRLNKDSGVEEIFEVLSSEDIPTVLKQEKIAFLKKLGLIQNAYNKNRDWNNKKIQTTIFRQWHYFSSYVYTHDTNMVYTLEDYSQKFMKNINLNTKNELAKIGSGDIISKEKVREAFTKIKQIPDLAKMAHWMRVFLGYRNREAVFYYAYLDHCKYFFDEISSRLGIEGEDIAFLSKEDIINGLSKNLSMKKIVDERKEKGFVIKQVGDSIKVITGIPKEDNHEKAILEVSQLNGMTACKGRVTGRAKIVFNPKIEGNEFQQGDVLITSMTEPSFVPLMKKASAIVTDEGGVLCHVAIVARELNKPCVIGTKVATHVFRNNDLIEVDADKGTIKILKRA